MMKTSLSQHYIDENPYKKKELQEFMRKRVVSLASPKDQYISDGDNEWATDAPSAYRSFGLFTITRSQDAIDKDREAKKGKNSKEKQDAKQKLLGYHNIRKVNKDDSTLNDEWVLMHLEHYATSNRGLKNRNGIPEMPKYAELGRVVSQGLNQGIGEDTRIQSKSRKNKRGKGAESRILHDSKALEYIERKVQEITEEKLDQYRPHQRKKAKKTLGL